MGQKNRRLKQGMENSANSKEENATYGSMNMCTGNRWQHSSVTAEIPERAEKVHCN